MSNSNGLNRNNGHENRNQSNGNSLLNGNGNETWSEDLISTLALSVSLLSPKTTSSTPTLALTNNSLNNNNRRHTAPSNAAAVDGLPLLNKTNSKPPSLSSRFSTGNNFGYHSSTEQFSSKAPLSAGLFTPHSPASYQSPMSSTASDSSALAVTTAGSGVNQSISYIGSSGKNSPQLCRNLANLNYQLQRSTILTPKSGSFQSDTTIDEFNTNNTEHTSSLQYIQRSSPPPAHRKTPYSPFGTKQDYMHNSGSTPVSQSQLDVNDRSMIFASVQYDQRCHHPLASSLSTDLNPLRTLQAEGIAGNNISQPHSSENQMSLQTTMDLVTVHDTHSGIIMASPGPGLSSSVPRSISPSNRWNRLISFGRVIVSNTLISRIFSRRPNGNISTNSSSTSSSVNSWSIIRLICNEQLFSWLTVQGVLFMLQIIYACFILQRQTMSSRIAILDQRSRILLLVFMVWTIIGVGFLGADNNSSNRDPYCIPSNDPVFGLAFKIIVFHSLLIGLYFLPCSSFLLSRVVPTSIASGLTRTATKPMIDKLGSTSMTEGMFGGDPEEAVCAICLGEYAPNETIRFLPCRHHFHLECVDQWLFTDKSCPLCKHDIDKPPVGDRSNARTNNRNDNTCNNEPMVDNNMASDRFQVIVA
ncbi:hypothetical protein BGZ46_004043 [Entomortierella lignicola]|nr:hypothetical protein BGZ46_004043 [Entomortierella lignicola]